MENVMSAGQVSYEAAKPLRRKEFSELFYIYCENFYNLIRFMILSVGVWLSVIKGIFISPKQKKIAGQLALITGGGNGLGKALAIRLAKEGCNIAIVDVDFPAAERTAGDLKSFGVKTKAYKVDVSNYDEVRNLSLTIEDDLGPVDILINNAGLMPKISLMEGRSDEIEKIIAVNLTSNFWTVRLFLESMLRRRKGHIVAISSIAGLQGLGRAVAYSATKFAIRGFMEALREELRLENSHHDIITTTVFPYFIATRKDLMDMMKESKIFETRPPLNVDDAAEIIVEAMLENKTNVLVPHTSTLETLFYRCLPIEIQDLMKNILAKEVIPRIQH